MENTENDQYMKEKYEELQMLDRELKNIEGKLDELAEQEHNVLVTKDALEQFQKLKGDEEILVPLSNGIFFKANIKNKDSLIINVGKEVLVDKTPEDTIKLMENQRQNIENHKIKLIQKHQKSLEIMQNQTASVQQELKL